MHDAERLVCSVRTLAGRPLRSKLGYRERGQREVTEARMWGSWGRGQEGEQWGGRPRGKGDAPGG